MAASGRIVAVMKSLFSCHYNESVLIWCSAITKEWPECRKMQLYKPPLLNISWSGYITITFLTNWGFTWPTTVWQAWSPIEPPSFSLMLGKSLVGLPAAIACWWICFLIVIMVNGKNFETVLWFSTYLFDLCSGGMWVTLDYSFSLTRIPEESRDCESQCLVNIFQNNVTKHKWQQKLRNSSHRTNCKHSHCILYHLTQGRKYGLKSSVLILMLHSYTSWYLFHNFSTRTSRQYIVHLLLQETHIRRKMKTLTISKLLIIIRQGREIKFHKVINAF